MVLDGAATGAAWALCIRVIGLHEEQSGELLRSMLFNSYAFLLGFLPAAILIYSVVDRFAPIRTWVLIALSLVFYGYWDVRFLPLMIASIMVNWLASRLYAVTKHSTVIAGAIFVNLVVLGIFKYTNFFAENFAVLFGVPITRFEWVLPLGISFFTFHHIMYLVDLGRGRAPIYPLDRYALYICFFPQAIAGPIARWNEVIHQFGQRAFAPGWERRCAIGATLIVLGLLQKVVIGDPLAHVLDPIYAKALTGPVTPNEAWIAPAFAFQVFFDFAAYSDIAIGLSLIFGIRLPINFDAPFRATSMVEFWQRWHMTLARFLRDYVFIPLSRIRIGAPRHRMIRALFAIILTMALCGLWHGAGWTFVLWGTLQGVAIVFAAVWARYLPSPPAVVGWAATVGFFLITIVLFRAGTLEAAWRIYEGMIGWPTDRLAGRNTIILAFVVAVLLPPSHELCRRLTEWPNRAVAAGMAAAMTMILVLLGSGENYQFVYFQF
jgi:D-alanyl-lipoteichoic acid acyltransferase DltB (MBOAT superfamily)